MPLYQIFTDLHQKHMKIYECTGYNRRILEFHHCSEEKIDLVPKNLCESIITISHHRVTLLHVAKLKVMGWPVVLVIVLPRCPKLDAILHASCMLHPHEVVVPWTIIRNLQTRQYIIDENPTKKKGNQYIYINYHLAELKM